MSCHSGGRLWGLQYMFINGAYSWMLQTHRYIPPNDHTINHKLESVPSFQFTTLAKATLAIKTFF